MAMVLRALRCWRTTMRAREGIEPGAQGFRLNASAALAIGCLAAPREVYADVPAALRWGDFQALNAVRGFDEVQRMFEAVVHGPVALATLDPPVGARARP